MGRRRTGGIQRRGGSYRISYYSGDVRHFETFETLEDAQRELANRIAAASNGIPISSKPNTVLFGELCADLRNEYIVNKRKSLAALDVRMERHIVPVFGERKASQITTAMIRSYIVRRQSEMVKGRHTKNATIKRELETIGRAFRLAVQGGKLMHMPHVPGLKVNNVRKGFFDAAEVGRLCVHLSPTLALVVRFGYLTGWRLGEIRGLRWTNVDWAANEIRLDAGTTKSGEGRVFPLTPSLRAILDEAGTVVDPAEKAAGKRVPQSNVRALRTARTHVFWIRNGPVGNFKKAWATACHNAGMCTDDSKGKCLGKTRIFHDLRRSAVRRMVQGGMSQQEIMSLCGWETSSMFSRYTILTTADLRSALDRMESGAGNGANTRGS